MPAYRRRLFLAALPAAALFAGSLSAPAGAAEVAAAGEMRLDTISVTATRSEKSTFETPQTVTVIDEQELDRHTVTRPSDLTRYEPGVDVTNQPARTGSGGFTIRGIGDNRVRIQIDGVRVPDFPGTNAPSGTYTRDFVDMELLKRVEIVRGPASALYGSDAIGGVVAFETKDPDDYLKRVGKDWTAVIKGGYDSADRSLSKTLVAAGRAAWAEGMVAYTRRDGHALGTSGSLSANPQDTASNNVLAKLVLRPTGEDRVRFTVESFDKKVETDVVSDRSATVLDSRGEDRTRRLRLSVDHTHTAPIGFIDQLQWRLFTTRVTRDEDTTQLRRSGTALARRISNFDYEQSIVGGEVQLSSTVTLFGLKNSFTYGATLERSKTKRPRDRYETALATGAVTRSFSGGPGVPPEAFPNKNFPDTTTLQGGIYVQDEIAAGRLTVTPALRLDYYKMTPHPDASFLNTNIRNFRVDEVSDVALSPKLGATYALTDALTVYGQYARGFRSPPYDDANIGFTNGPSRYEILPNANLKAEKSDGFEAGLRGRFADGSSFGVSAFYNLYSDFIESRQIGIRNGITQFQARNIANVEIWGVDGRGEWRFLPEWGLFGSAAFARGEDRDTGLPIDSVAPLTGVLGVRYDRADGWGAELLGRGATRHSRVSTPGNFQAPGYAVADANISYEWDPTLSINAGVFNIFDRKTFNYRDVSGLGANRTDIDRYARPGRTFAVNATLRW
ncbi:TonB-dependent hemoglobin/transferrin/lactoferrin family receptor [Azospirillum thermophilum]|uniref:TonB-dependent hemoglobin/transferrin/lactoferrin family receptor n=1 Tax=Azospirillum thermophilum TaxID=2202148 RepID=A0A2S2CLK4_9PROT|nr:TonB-dependent hemoglobin/transferrin/lactoferrin family receptor [Azospirillum thermophilum]AWK85393.1 TonB-dependent hemoglobin/transferrin/lactoferrin family receptor [Azospirillum thermophilum]